MNDWMTDDWITEWLMWIFATHHNTAKFQRNFALKRTNYSNLQRNTEAWVGQFLYLWDILTVSDFKKILLLIWALFMIYEAVETILWAQLCCKIAGKMRKWFICRPSILTNGWLYRMYSFSYLAPMLFEN